jgi:hypothetical protein
MEESAPQFRQSSLWDTTINLTNAILGAGMLSLPHAWAGLGVLGGGECDLWSASLTALAVTATAMGGMLLTLPSPACLAACRSPLPHTLPCPAWSFPLQPP